MLNVYILFVSVKKFNTDHILAVVAVETAAKVNVKDVFLSDDFVAILSNRYIDGLSRSLLTHVFNRKVYVYKYTRHPFDLVKQFDKHAFRSGEYVYIRPMKKQLFHALVWFLKRNYGITYKFKFKYTLEVRQGSS